MLIATRWLSVYDITLSTIYMFDVYAIFYFSFLRKEDKKLYKSMLNTIYCHHKLSDKVKTRIGAHQNKLKRKKITKAVKETDKIVHKVIVDENKIRLYMSIYSSALRVMRKYVKVFQQAKPAIFRVTHRAGRCFY